MKEILVKAGLLVTVMALGALAAEKVYQGAGHDVNPLLPKVVTPGAENGLPPSDAIVLFNGTDLSAWQSGGDGAPAAWKVENGIMEVVKKAGNIQTREAFGSCQLHLEWATPEVAVGNGQERGNSGVFLMGLYEVQILDSYENETYRDGQAGAIYTQSPPLVNASRKPGQWQTYDIIFHAPVFKADALEKPATVTVLHNGVLVQDHWQITGVTFQEKGARYEPHAEKLPLQLQDHNNPVRFRNIWIRPLND